MAKLDELKNYTEIKQIIHDAFLGFIKELVDMETQIIANYHNNPTIPFDYYNLMIREIHTKIDCKREVYQRLFGESLE